MSFTPGDWEVYFGHDGQFRDSPKVLKPNHDGEPGFVVAQVEYDRDLIKTAANAHLIAAAPAMYEALKGILADLENVIQPDVLERTKEALAKADGK